MSGVRDSYQLTFKRKKIFDRWDIADSALERQQEVRQPEQSLQTLKCEQLFRQSAFLHSNIEEFQNKKSQYQTKIRMSQSDIKRNSSELFQLCNKDDQSQSEDIQNTLKDKLGEMYINLRKGKALNIQIKRYFMGINRVNHDPSTTKIEFTKTPQQAKQALKDTMGSIRQKTLKLRQALAIQQKGIILSPLFDYEESFQSRYSQLNTALSPSGVADIHFLMMYELDELGKMQKQHEKSLEESQREYSRWEAVVDSLYLMKNQKKEMSDGIRDMGVASKGEGRPYDILQEAQVTQSMYKNNEKIYKSNLSNFVRVNAEINLYLFSLRRKEYTEQLNEFEGSLEKYQTVQGDLEFLAERRSAFQDFRSKVQVSEGNKMDQREKKQVLNGYYECVKYKTKSKDVANYKDNLLTEMESFFRERGIAVPQRIDGSSTIQAKLSKEVQFFQRLHKLPLQERVVFLKSNSKLVNALCYEAGQIYSANKDAQTHRYMTALKYSQIIADSKILPNFASKNLLQVFRTQGRWSGLPLGFTQTLMNYANDLRIVNLGASKSKKDTQKLRQNLERVGGKVKTDQQFNAAIQHAFEQSDIDFVIADREFGGRMSGYDSILQTALDDELWQQCINAVKDACITSGLKNEKITTSIQKQIFYSFRVLCTLVTNDPLSERKLINLDGLINYIYQTLDKQYLVSAPSGKVVHILKLLLFKEYLAFFLAKFINTNAYCSCISSIIQMCKYILYSQQAINQIDNQQINKNKELFQTQEIGQLMRLQNQMNSVKVDEKVKKEKPQIYEMTVGLLKNLKKLPLTIASKSDISQFPSYIRFPSMMQELKSIKSVWNLQDYALAFVTADRTNQLTSIINNEYQSYQNVIIRDKKGINRYFQKLKAQNQQKIVSVMKETQDILTEYGKIEGNSKIVRDSILKMQQKSN